MMKRATIFSFLAGIFVSAHAQTDTSSVLDSITNESQLIPVISISGDVLESNSQSQNISGLLQSSRDVFVQAAGYNFSAARFKMRGYSSENFTVMMNGIPLNDPESGWAIWSYWGGLNDITRYQEVKNGIASSPYNFSSIGGYSNINIRASKMRAGSRFSYAISNRSYRNRVMFTHSTGLMKNNWAFTVSGSTRWADEGYVEGTNYSSGSYFFSAEKKINNRHSIGFVALGAPTVQGRRGIAVQEVYNLTGNNYYNPYWGYQNGKKRNARVRNNHKPMFFLSHYWDINEKSKLTTTLYHATGRTGSTGINWFDAKNPRPDYYKYRPSYWQDQNPAYAEQLAQQWATDPSVSQINWDDFYLANRKNLYTVNNVDGIAGNDFTGNRSKYILEDRRIDPRQWTFKTIYNKVYNDHITYSSGIEASIYKSKNFKKLKDLLGGDFWIDIYNFAVFAGASPDSAQNNLDQPNRLIKEGDVFGYNYEMHQNKFEWFANIEFKYNKLEGYAALSLTSTSFWRDGKYRNQLFPNNSYGKSAVNNYFNYAVKTGWVYKITGRHFATVNAMYGTRAPFMRNAYLNPQNRDDLVPGLTDQQIMSADINYIVRYSNFKMRLTGFYSEINNQTWTRSYYHDELNAFINYSMSDVDQLFQGIEFGFEAKVKTVWAVTGAFTTGQYVYNSRPKATITSNNSTEVLAENKTIYFKNFRIGGMPQTAANIGLKYNSPKYWFAGVNFNYFTDIYLDANPDRRTEEAVAKFVDTDPQYHEMIDQQKLDPGYTLDAFAGKSWKVKKYIIRVNVNVSNVLNKTDFATGGFEQLRYNITNINKFPPKIGYMYGRTYFGMISVLF